MALYTPGMAKLVDQMKATIEASGKSRYRISKDTGINASILCRLVNGERSLSVETLETLAAYFDLTITLAPNSKQRKK